MSSPNILLLTVDCLRYDHCGFNGYTKPTTPTLTELTQSSLVFDTAVATGPYTPESVPGFLAGLHGYNSAYYSDVDWTAIPNDAETLASHFRDAGWETIATISNPQLTTERNFDTGFDSFRNLRTEDTQTEIGNPPGSAGPLRERVSSVLYSFRDRIRSMENTTLSSALYALYRYQQLRTDWPTTRGKVVVDRLLDNLNTRDREQPFFAWTHLMDLHAPLHPDSIREGGLAWSDATARHLLTDAGRMANQHTPAYETMYDSALRHVDAQIARIIDYLQEEGVWDETILVVTADHGEALFERGVYGHQYHNMFDELLHVPFLIRTPNETAERFDAPFSLAWLHELLADLVNIDRGPFPAKSGRSSHLDDEDCAIVLSDSVSHRGHTVTARTACHKFVRHFGEPLYHEHQLASAVEPFNGEGVTYDLRADPAEHLPLDATESPANLRELAADVHVHPSEIPSLTGELDTETKARLEDLGYVE
ncbi:sulfatase-like hydrolase/transferase [Halococcus thailandensis]|uniref:Sulfatase n=1 Tax=Halococcus thailandensis JCM 13552 TaxID=1227457 RepID=M0MTZ4_9EURY|nr:sulfatase-like hydrolase/transferase [Halococcus thailandensis]EMA48239.1 sulfatase [Halococcus thailandensis JCM 13552]